MNNEAEMDLIRVLKKCLDEHDPGIPSNNSNERNQGDIEALGYYPTV